MLPAPLILASSSQYRQALLHKLGLPFTTAVPDIDESTRPGETPEQLVARLATEKAQAVASSHDQGWIIGSDQVCVINQQILGKPGTIEAAFAQLRQASGQAITFYTGLCLLDATNGKRQLIVEPYRVHFRQLSDEMIKHYLQLEQPLDCAGSFKSEGLGITLFTAFEGRDPNSLIGLPLMALIDMLALWGVTLPLQP